MKRSYFIAVLIIFTVLVGQSKPVWSALSSTAYELPVRAPVSKPFDAPLSPYAGGNRGTEFAVTRGARITADAVGKVLFAGDIGAEGYVSVMHSDGLRTTFSYLATIAVKVNETVRAGQLIGLSSDRFQWGARIGDHAYLDPLILAASPGRVHLINDPKIDSK